MDDLVVERRAEACAGLLGAQAADAAGVGGGVVGEPAGELLPARVADADDVALVELADDLDDADREQALRARFQRAARTVVDDVVAARPRGQADPALPRAVRRAVRQEQGARPARRRGCGSGARAGPRGDDHRAAGLGHQPRRRQLALHAAGPQRAAAGAGQAEHLVVDLRHQRDDLGHRSTRPGRSDRGRRPRSG